MKVNGQIDEVKQSRPRLILRWVTIWQPHFFSLTEKISGKLGKFARSIGISKIPDWEVFLNDVCLAGKCVCDGFVHCPVEI